MNFYEKLRKGEKKLATALKDMTEVDLDIEAIIKAIRQNETEIKSFHLDLKKKEAIRIRVVDAADKERASIKELRSQIEEAEYNAKLDSHLKEMPSFQDVLLRQIEKNEENNNFFGPEFRASVKDIDVKEKLSHLIDHTLYLTHPNMVIYYNEMENKFNLELREMAKAVIDTGNRFYNPVQRLAPYCEEMLKVPELRQYLGLV